MQIREYNLDPLPQRETQVVIRTDRGVELGVLVSQLADDRPEPTEPGDDGADEAHHGQVTA